MVDCTEAEMYAIEGGDSFLKRLLIFIGILIAVLL
jgi:hypothetical protein